MTSIEDVRKQLRPYQLEGIQQMSKSNRWLACDDMGLGKTITCLTSFMEKVQGQDNFRALILCGANAMGVWREELNKWFNANAIIYSGTPAKRKNLWNEFAGSQCHFLITTYAMLKELPMVWDAVFADEYHTSGLMNRTTKTAQLFEKHLPHFKYVYLITGTPIRQGVIDLYEPLHIMDPQKFPNYWAFVNRYCVAIQTPFGKQIERNPSNVIAFRQMLNQYMVRRLKSEVLKDLPGKQRNPVPVEMTAKQAAAYRALSEEMMYVGEEAEDTIIAPNQMVTDLRLRQLLVCPRLLGVDDDGAGFLYLSEVVPTLLEANRPVVIFTPFRQAIPLIEDLIRGWQLGTAVYKLMGGMTPAAFADQWQKFQDPRKKNKVLLCVIKSGASFHATESADCFFLGYEWDFNFNVQAEDRLCRLGQNNFVQCNYLLHNGDSIDEAVKNRLNEKQLAADFIIGSEKQFRALMRKVRNTGGIE